ncbi:MAG: hypothetical protein KAS32_05740 [Candidatus Peribacteraceae bacterium]|nr:hypothetical protein [Candidatus Peribacteraceae bacterium]
MARMKLEEVRETFDNIKVHAPELDENMQPAFVLLNSTCGYDNDGKCHACNKFVGAHSDDGTFNSSGAYEAFCGGKFDSSEAIDNALAVGVDA